MPGSSLADLVLLRHGIAEPRQAGQDHPERPLTAAGRQRTQLVMAALVQRGLRLDRLLSSPYRRALQTAVLAKEAGSLQSSRWTNAFNLEAPLKRC